MDQRAPGHYSGDGGVGNVEVLHRPELVPTARASRPRMRDELRNYDTQRAKVTGDMARSAADIEHCARLVAQMSPDESDVVGVHLLACAEQFDVELRDGC